MRCFLCVCHLTKIHTRKISLDITVAVKDSVGNSYRPVARGDLCLVQDHLLTEVGSPGGRPNVTGLLRVRDSFVLFIPSNTLSCHFLLIGTIYFWSGLPDFQGRSPAGLRADFYEFSTLSKVTKVKLKGHVGHGQSKAHEIGRWAHINVKLQFTF